MFVLVLWRVVWCVGFGRVVLFVGLCLVLTVCFPFRWGALLCYDVVCCVVVCRVVLCCVFWCGELCCEVLVS